MKSGPLAAWLAVAISTSLVHAGQNPVDFVNSDLPEGSINGQSGWVITVQPPANADFVSKPGEGLALTENTGVAQSAAFLFLFDKFSKFGRDSFPGGMPVSLAANFTIKQETSSRKGRIFGVGWGMFAPVAANSLPFFAEFSRDTTAGGYILRLARTSDKTRIEGENTVVIPEEALGLSGTNTVSDPLQLSLTQNSEGKPTDWTTICMLVNLKTQKVFVLKNTILAPEVYKTDNFFQGIVNLRRSGEDGLSSVVISEFGADPAVDPTAQ